MTSGRIIGVEVIVKSIKLEFDEQTLERVQRLAETLHTSLENAIARAVERFEAQEADDPVLGVFSQEPELLDQVVDSAMHSRTCDPLRTTSG